MADSTPPTNPPAPPTPDQIAKDLAPPEFEIKLATGEVFKGKDEKEVLGKLAKAKEDATYAIRDREEQIRGLQAPPPSPASEGQKFDPQTYYNLFAQDPQAALTYQLSFLVGLPAEEVAPAIRYSYDVSQHAAALLETSAFHQRHPEFPGGDEATDLMIRKLNEKNMDWTADNLELVFSELSREGRLKPAQPQPETSHHVAPPPSFSPSAPSPSSDIISSFENLSSAEQEKLLRKWGMI